MLNRIRIVAMVRTMRRWKKIEMVMGRRMRAI
jgi:hypothetical protein